STRPALGHARWLLPPVREVPDDHPIATGGRQVPRTRRTAGRNRRSRSGAGPAHPSVPGPRRITSLVAVGDATPGQVVGRDLDLHAVAREDPDPVDRKSV